MQNNTGLKYYSFFVHFNSFEEESIWQNIADRAQSYYVNFLNSKDYGDNLLSTSFYFLVEKQVDFAKQNDVVSTSTYLGIPKTARLTLHFEYEYFLSLDVGEKLKLALNGILFLLRYWNENLKIPKGNPISTIAADFSDNLRVNKLLLSDDIVAKAFIKLVNPFRFSFDRFHFQGLREKDVLFDIYDIEKFLNNHLYKSNFGKSVNSVYFSYDIFDFGNKQVTQNFRATEKNYQYGKNKDLKFMEQYDSRLFLYTKKFEKQTQLGQVEYLREGLLSAILRIKDMKRKPKDFDVDKFYAEINEQMGRYKILYC